MVNVLPKPYSGAYLIALAECIILLFTIRIIQFPDVKEAYVKSVSTSSPMKTDRSIFVIARQRTFLIAAFGAFVAWSAMAIQMSATPLAMTAAGHSFSQVTSTVEYHLLGMFAPSFFTGILCNWVGSRLLILMGLLAELAGTLLFQLGFRISHFNLGLIIIGVGWNLGYVGASALLTKSYRPEEKTKTHSLYEAIVMISLLLSFSSAAIAEQSLGWMALTGRLVTIYLAVSVSILVIDTTFVFYKTRDLRTEIPVNDKVTPAELAT